MHFQIEEQVMRVQDMPLTPEGLLDVNFVRTQPFYNKDFQNSKEKFTVEFWVNLNSQINNLTNQVFLIIPINARLILFTHLITLSFQTLMLPQIHGIEDTNEPFNRSHSDLAKKLWEKLHDTANRKLSLKLSTNYHCHKPLANFIC